MGFTWLSTIEQFLVMRDSSREYYLLNYCIAIIKLLNLGHYYLHHIIKIEELIL